jgi:hypothetical protein
MCCAALLMPFDITLKLGPFFPTVVERLPLRSTLIG